MKTSRITIGLFVLCLALRAPGAETSDKPDIELGRKVYALCQACHETPDAPNRGPTLRGIFGRQAGSVRGFAYSRAMKTAKRVWDESTLDAFIAEPQVAVPGTTMPFPGNPNASERRALIAFLQTLR